MSAFAFDLDGTITSAPGAFGSLMAALVSAGHDVLIITAVCAPNTNAAQLAKIANLGLRQGVHFTNVVLIDGGQGTAPEMATAGQAKLATIRERGVVLYVDDRLDWCTEARSACPTLWVVPA